MPEGLDMAVRLMTPGELASIHAHPPYAYGSRADRPQVLTPAPPHASCRPCLSAGPAMHCRCSPL